MAGAFKVAEKAVAVSALGIGAGLVYAAKKAGEFEQQMSRTGAVADASAKQMDRLRKQALKAGADTKFSALEAAQAQTELAKGGLKTARILKGGLAGALGLAAAGELDLAQAAQTTANALNLFGLRGGKATHVADALAKAANATTADVSDFAIALQQGGSAAKAAGLSFNQTILGLEALAASGIKGSDAGTSLKTTLLQLLTPTAKQKELTKKLNLDWTTQAGKMKDLASISKMLRAETAGMTKEQRTAAFATLAGTDGVRTLISLYDTGPAKLNKFGRGLREQGTAAETAAKKQDNLFGSLEQLQGSVETLAITIGTAALPTLRNLADGAKETVNDLARVFGRKDLDLGEKLAKSWEIIKLDSAPLIEEVKRAVKALDIPKRLGDALSAATPIIAKAAGGAAIIAAKSFARAFTEADIWGKLVLGGWLFSKMGGMRAFTAMGVTAGGAMGTGMATGIGGSGAGVMGKVKGILGGVRGLAARFAALDFAVNLVTTKGEPISAAINTAHDLTFGIVPKLKKPDANVVVNQDFVAAKARGVQLDSKGFATGSGNLGKLKPDLSAAAGAAEKFAGSMRKSFEFFQKAGDSRGLGELAKQARDIAQRFPAAGSVLTDFANTAAQAAKDAAGSFRNLAQLGGKHLRKIRQETAETAFDIQNRLGWGSRAAKEQVSRSFSQAAAAIRQSMKDGTVSTKKGTAEINRLMIEALGNFGFSKAQALHYAKSSVGDTQGKSHGAGSKSGFQRGGPINMGAASGDSVPAMLERGEYVVNRRAVGKVGRKALDALNFGAAPRFQGGGIVELLHPFNDPAGHGGANSHLHIAMLNIKALVALGHKLQRLGWLVSENPAFGGVGGMHAKGGYHYTGQAIDVNWPNAGQEGAKIKALLPMLGGMSVGAVAKLKRVLVQGPDSPLKGIVQGALDATRAGAQARLTALTSMTGVEGRESAGGAYDKTALMRLWKQANGRMGNPNLMAAIALAESGGNPSARNPSGASGLWQILGEPFPGDVFDPLTNARMAGSKLRSQGLSAWEVYTKGSYRQFLQNGGIAGMQAGGPTPAGPGYAQPRKTGATGLNRTLRKIRTGNRGVRRDAVHGLLKKIQGIDLPKGLQATLKTLGENSTIFGEYADRAGQLSITDDDGNLVTEGMVNGKTQVEWIRDQLEALFRWRNAIIDAERIAVAKRDETTKLILRARFELAAVAGNITAAVGDRKGLDAQLTKAQKHPTRNKALIKALKTQIGDLDDAQKPRVRVRDALKDRILPALRGKRESLNTARGVLLESLTGVQGLGSPMNRMTTLPGLGVLGGNIFDVQMRLGELTAVKPKITDPSTVEGGERAGILEQLLREANLRTAVSEAHFKVFQGMPQFATGGIVPGVTGAAVPAVVHAGEGVFTRDQMAAIGGSQIAVIIQDGAVREDRIKVLAGKEADAALRRAGRTGSRPLPGRGGG